MAAIREELTLVDRITAPLTRYISVAEKASGAISDAKSSTNQLTQSQETASNATSSAANSLKLYESVANSVERKLISLNASFDAMLSQQERMAAAGQQNTAAFTQLDQKMDKTGEKIRALDGEYNALRKAMEPLEAQIKQERIEAERAAQAQTKHESRLRAVRNSISGLISKLTGLNRAQKAYDGLDRQFRRFALTLFSVSRIFNFMKSALERAPQSIQNSWKAASDSMRDLFAGGFVAALQGLQPALDRLSAMLNSESGQKFARGIETAFRFAGQAIGVFVDAGSKLIGFLGDNFQTVMTVAAVVAGIFAAQMLVSAAATIAANLPLIAFIGLISALVVGLMSAGITSEEIFSAIGAGIGWVYALAYNLVADLWNTITNFAEFIANVFNDPLRAVANLFFDTFDQILGVIETVAGAADAILGTDMAGAVSGFRSKMQSWVDENIGENEIQLDRMDKLDYKDTMADFAEKAEDLASAFSDFSLENALGAPLSQIAGDTKAIKNSVSATQEDLKMMVDMAERRFVANVNLSAPAPTITIQGQNTGNSREDTRRMLNQIAKVLQEDMNSSTQMNYAFIH